MAITLRQHHHKHSDNPVGVIRIQWPDRIHAGSLLICAVTTNGSGTATMGNPWREVGRVFNDPIRTTIFARGNAPAGVEDPEVVFNGQGYAGISIFEVKGSAGEFSRVDCLDKEKRYIANGVSVWTGGDITTTIAASFWLGVASCRNNNPIDTPSSGGWTRAGEARTQGQGGAQKMSQAIFYKITSATDVMGFDAPIRNLSGGETRPYIGWALNFGNAASTGGGTTDPPPGGGEPPGGGAGGGGGETTEPDDGGGTSVAGTGGIPPVVPAWITHAGGGLWTGGRASRYMYYSPDGTTWYKHSLRFTGDAMAAVGDGKYIYVWDHTQGTQVIWKAAAEFPETEQAPFIIHQGQRFPYGLAIQGGYLYKWSGAKLVEYFLDVDKDNPAKAHVAYTAGVSGNLDGGGITATDTSVVFFGAKQGRTTVYEYTAEINTNGERVAAARPIWTLPGGFTGKAIAYQGGTVFVLGEQGDRLDLWGLPLFDRRPLYLGSIRADQNMDGVSLAPSLGDQLLIGCTKGTSGVDLVNYLFAYDTVLDAFSEIGSHSTLTDGDLGGVVTFLNKRMMLLTTAGSINTIQFDPDTNISSGSFSEVSAAWDFDLPEAEKILAGFHVQHSPLAGGASFSVDYQIDEDGNWVNGSAISTPASATRTYVPISSNSSTKKFRILRVRINGSNGIKIYSVTARGTTVDYVEVWDLVLRIRDEAPGLRPSDRQADAEVLRDYLFDIANDKSVVQFNDGYRYRSNNFSTHDVVVENPQDVIERRAEGNVRVRLRSVAPE